MATLKSASYFFKTPLLLHLSPYSAMAKPSPSPLLETTSVLSLALAVQPSCPSVVSTSCLAVLAASFLKCSSSVLRSPLLDPETPRCHAARPAKARTRMGKDTAQPAEHNEVWAGRGGWQGGVGKVWRRQPRGEWIWEGRGSTST